MENKRNLHRGGVEIMTTQDKIKMFCSYLKEHQYISSFHVYNGELGGTCEWEIYHQITGRVNNKHFNVVIMKRKGLDLYIEIAETTECIPFIKHILSKFGLS